ncbi:MAG TPA: hypothetical protein VGY66_29280 [Gemmataceae bacterium]|jgi:hypothetical protein|nr:hypothetical protein [Gemmataceae bacterium]
MTISLTDALAQVELEPGKTYRCQVKGRWVELRVLEASPAGVAKPFSQVDVMLDPWAELPGPTVAVSRQAKIGKPLPFDIPDIPEDAQPS